MCMDTCELQKGVLASMKLDIKVILSQHGCKNQIQVHSFYFFFQNIFSVYGICPACMSLHYMQSLSTEVRSRHPMSWD